MISAYFFRLLCWLLHYSQKLPLSLVFVCRNSSVIIADIKLPDDCGPSPIVGDDPRWSAMIPDQHRACTGASVCVGTGEFLGYGVVAVCSREGFRNPSTSSIHNFTFEEQEVSSPEQTKTERNDSVCVEYFKHSMS